MSTATLLEPVLTGGIPDPHFFNGRVLTAEDLSDLPGRIRAETQPARSRYRIGHCTGPRSITHQRLAGWSAHRACNARGLRSIVMAKRLNSVWMWIWR